MIPARGHYDAVYTSTINGRTIKTTRPVEAFNSNGHAMVLDLATGTLVVASRRPGFVRVDPSAEHVAGVIPGGGWRIDFTDKDGHQWTEQVVAWTVNSAGNAVPLTIQEDDYAVAMEVTDLSQGRLIPPGGVDGGQVS